MSQPHALVDLVAAGTAEAEQLLPLVRAYHQFENVLMTDRQRLEAIRPLLVPDSPAGRIWFIREHGSVVGYVALCFGYSIEFRGRDAFIDELFLLETARGRGIGATVLDLVKARAVELGVVALHLEVDRGNDRARRRYAKAGFEARQRFHLMSWRG